MRFRFSAFFLTGLVACILSTFALRAGFAQTDARGLLVQNASTPERRLALVIGNGAYRDSPLANPVNDARDMATALRGFGFEVIFGENLSQTEMKRNIRLFGEKIRNGGVGLFYYAGHGMQVKGSNYLIPVDARITSEAEVEYESVNVGLVLAQMEAARNRLNLVILDACRNNPFARSFRSTQSGLASLDAPSGTMIAYATAPGSVAADGERRNGLYTEHLLTAMRVPGQPIEEVFKQVRKQVRDKTQGKQVPWESSSLEGAFAFVGSVGAGNPVGPEAMEQSFWESIKFSTSANDYRAYVEKYPNGRFAKVARTRAYELDQKPAPTDPPGTSYWMTSENYQKEFMRQAALGNFAPVTEGRNYYGESQYRATFRPPPTGWKAWECRHSLTREAYDQFHQKLAAQGYKQIWVQTFVDQAGVTRYQATWLK